MSRTLISLASFAGMAVAVATFGAAQPASAAPDACKIVSSADAGKAAGAPVTSTTSRTTANATSCTYKTSTPGKGFLVTVMPLSSTDAAKTVFHQMVTSSMTYTAPSQALPGIGDEGHRLGPMIYVRKSDTIYVFSALASDGNGAGALRTIAVAKTGLAHVK